MEFNTGSYTWEQFRNEYLNLPLTALKGRIEALDKPGGTQEAVKIICSLPVAAADCLAKKLVKDGRNFTIDDIEKLSASLSGREFDECVASRKGVYMPKQLKFLERRVSPVLHRKLYLDYLCAFPTAVTDPLFNRLLKQLSADELDRLALNLPLRPALLEKAARNFESFGELGKLRILFRMSVAEADKRAFGQMLCHINHDSLFDALEIARTSGNTAAADAILQELNGDTPEDDFRPSEKAFVAVMKAQNYSEYSGMRAEINRL